MTVHGVLYPASTSRRYGLPLQWAAAPEALAKGRHVRVLDAETPWQDQWVGTVATVHSVEGSGSKVFYRLVMQNGSILAYFPSLVEPIDEDERAVDE